MIKRSTKLNQILKLGHHCNKCGHCCSYGSGFVLKEETKELAKNLKISEKEFIDKYLTKNFLYNTEIYNFNTKGKPFGKCVFLKDKQCSIQEFKPLHCKIGNCSEHGEELSVWFYVNYLVNKTDPESIRQWKIYIETGGKMIEGAELKDLVPDKKLLKKILSYEILQ